jgi:hypothetical protein
MKKIVALIVALALSPAIASASQDTDMIKATTTAAASARAAGNRIYVVSGLVFVAHGKNPPHQVTDNEVIVSDTLINTGDKSSALLRFEDGQVVTMQANSTFQVGKYRYDANRIEKSSIIFSMFKGGMRFVTGLIGQKRKQAFRLLTPNATIGIRGTEFMVAMAGNSIYSQVLAGKIRMTNDAGMIVVGAGQTAIVTSSSTLASLVSALAIPPGTFGNLLSIPVDPSVISHAAHAPARGSISALAPVPVIVTAPIPVTASVSAPTDSAAATATTSSQAGGSRVYVVNGKVFVSQGKNPAHRVIANETIVSDTQVNTVDNSSALLRFEDGQVVTMQANSTFHVREYHYDAKQIENSSIDFSMLKGGLRFVTGLIGQQRKQAFRLSTPNATIGIRGTDFMLNMVDHSIYSQVLTGSISMTNAAGAASVGAGQTAIVTSSNTLASLVAAASIPSGTFGALLSIPVNPSAIPVPVPVPVPEPAPEPATALVPPDLAPPPAPEPVKKESRSGLGMTGKIGTLGYGAEFSYGSSDSFSTRVGINSFKRTYNSSSGTANYDFKVQLQTASVLADWYPFEGRFRTSAGLLYNNDKLTLKAVPGVSGYTVGGVTYTGVTSVDATIAFNKVAPYFGIGWGNPVANDKGWGLVSDIGVMFQGKPKTNLTVACVTACPTATDIANENAKLESDLSHFKWWPVISLGISYQW